MELTHIDTGMSFQAGLEWLRSVMDRHPAATIAIEGCCGAGKTTFANLAASEFGCEIIPMDWYYLPFCKRIPDWKTVPGENMDFERFDLEVARNRDAGSAFLIRRYDPKNDCFTDKKMIDPKRPIIVEGSYCRHPKVRLHYDGTMYIRCSPQTQEARLLQREKENYQGFADLWIPLEAAYSRLYRIEENSDIVVET